MAKTYKTTLTIMGKVDKSLKAAFKAAESSAAKTAAKVKSGLANAAKAAGKAVVAGAVAGTVAVTALGTAAVTNAAKMQTEMQNVATLLDGTATEVASRTSELSEDVIKVSNSTGIATSDLTSGLYDVISAVGDTEDSVKILEISAKAAAAGNAETAEAVSLLTAVTKGYGDTSAEAFGKASDLAFQTVKLGQTTFPELAASIGKVTPLAASLGVSQEELFGVFATLTGVTGSAAEVSTQYKAALSGLMSPSTDMTKKLKELGYNTGSAAIEALGFNGTLQALMESCNGDVEVMAKLFSSVEAQTAILSLCGEQADNLTSKTQAMYEANGAASNAFDTQTKSLSYTLQRIKNLGTNFLTSVGQKILPIVADLAEKALPKIEVALDNIAPAISNLIDRAGPAVSEVTQAVGNAIDGIIGKATEIKPKVQEIVQSIEPLSQAIINNVIPEIANFAQVLSATLSPAISNIGPAAQDVITVITYFAKETLPQIINVSGNVLVSFIKILSTISQWKSLRTAIALIAAAYASWKIASTITNVVRMTKAITLLSAAKLKDKAETVYLLALYAKDAVVKGASTVATYAMTAATTVWNGVCGIATAVTTALGAAFTFLTSPIGLIIVAIAAVVAVGGLLYQNWDTVCQVANNLYQGFLNLCSYIAGVAVSAFQSLFSYIQSTPAFQSLMAYVEMIRTVFSNLIQFIQNVFTGNWEAAWQNIVNSFSAIFGGIKDIASNVIKGCIAPINAIIRGINKVKTASGGSAIPEISFSGFANGATVKSPTLAWIAEAGYPETVVPHKNTPRSRALLNEAAKGVYGNDAGGSSSSTKKYTINYAPVIYGGGQSVKEELREDFERFKEFFGQLGDEDDREVFA